MFITKAWYDVLSQLFADVDLYCAESKSKFLLYSLCYAKACNELAEPIFTSLHLANTAP